MSEFDVIIECDLCGGEFEHTLPPGNLDPDPALVEGCDSPLHWWLCPKCQGYVQAARDYQEAKRANPEAPHYGLTPFEAPLPPLNSGNATFNPSVCPGDLKECRANNPKNDCAYHCPAGPITGEESPHLAKCECGAEKCGCKNYGPGHSDWCPVKEPKGRMP